MPGASAFATSNVFPEQSENLLIVSQDHVRLFIPKQLFESSSSLLRAMVQAHQPNGSKKMEIYMDTPASMLERLFGFMYPKAAGPSICSVDELAKLFEVAKKYKMNHIHSQLSKELVKAASTDSGSLETLFRREPLKSLVLAHHHNCATEFPVILAEVMCCRLHRGIGDAHNGALPLSLVQFIQSERTKRAELLQGKLQDLFKYHTTRGCPVRWVNRFQKIAAKELKEEPRFSILERLVKGHGDGAISSGLLKLSAKDTILKWCEELTALETKPPEYHLP